MRYNNSVFTSLDTTVLNRIKSFGIKRRFRGHRSSVKKAKTRDWNIGVHYNLLRPLGRKIIKFSEKKNLAFAVVNTQSICNKVNEFLHHILENGIDVCCVTETWLENNNPKHEQIRADLRVSGYGFIDVTRNFKTGGGTGIIFKKALNVKLIDFGQKTSFEYSVYKMECSLMTIHIIIVYRPTYSPTHPVSTTVFFEEFSTFLEEFLLNHQSVIICGDFNIHVNKHDDLDTVALSEMCDIMGLNQLVNCPTHKYGNTLDLIIVRESSKIILSEPTEDYLISDHCFIHTCISVPKPNCKRELRKFRCIKDINKENFATDLQQFNENAALLDKADDLAKFYNSKLKTILDKHAPEKEKYVTIRPTIPWFTDESTCFKRSCRKAERMWRAERTNENEYFYKCTKRAYKKHLSYNKYKHINSAITECGKDTGKMYKLVFSILDRIKENPMPPSKDDESLADDFSNYFLDKIVTIRNALEKYDLYDPSISGQCLQHFDKFLPVSEQDMLKVIKTSKPTTCPTDPIPSKLVKEYANVLLPTITNIVNLSLKSGIFATEWKTAVIRPLLKKKGLDVILKNYRPVSNLSFISKLVEKCALNQFMRYLEINKLLPDYQSAYRRGFSTETALLKLSSDILWNMERQRVTALTALDLSAAFDTVDHGVLVELLHKTFGVSNNALSWFKTYLSPRMAEVHVNSSSSEAKKLDFSVPQGSICGPVLYTAYASTLENYIKDSNVSLVGYADDHSAYDSFNPNNIQNEYYVVQNLEHTLESVNNWMHLNRLKLNPSKTEFILFGSQQQLAKCNTNAITVVDATVKMSDSIKYLGAHLDKQLNFKRFTSEKCRTVSLNINRIKQIRHYLSMDSCKQIVQSLITSHLDYANSIIYGLPECTIIRLQRLQNRAAKLVLRWKYTDSSTEALKQLHWLPIRHRINFKLACIVFKCINNVDGPQYLKEMLHVRSSNYSIRSIDAQARTLTIPSTKRKTFADRSFAISGPTVWNNIPVNIRKIPDFNVFKTSLKTHYFLKAFM